ncbi:hypothetical protein NL676_010208 [Syzygium grande]|nr:hypothetical protein NL676_010208 [Syzygium grande]
MIPPSPPHPGAVQKRRRLFANSRSHKFPPIAAAAAVWGRVDGWLPVTVDFLRRVGEEIHRSSEARCFPRCRL